VDVRGLVWLAGTGLVCAAAVAVNPAGPVMLLYPFKTVSIGVLQDFIQEWQSPNFHLLMVQPFLWLLFATLAATAWSRRGIDLTDWLTVGGVAYLGFAAGRNVALLAVVAPPVLTHHLQAGWEDLKARTPRWGQLIRLSSAPPRGAMLALNWLVLVVVAAAALAKVALVVPASVNETALAKVVPMDAAAFVLRTRPPGKLFNSYNFGAYLMWALYPAYPVFVDGRTDLYNDQFLRGYLDVMLARPGYQTTLDGYGVNVVLVEADAVLANRLADDPAWRKAYADSVAVVYEREQKP